MVGGGESRGYFLLTGKRKGVECVDMKANNQTIRKVNVGMTDEWWAIDTVGNCGERVFSNVVRVSDPLGINPGISIGFGTFGLRGMKAALRLIEKERKKFGLVTLKWMR